MLVHEVHRIHRRLVLFWIVLVETFLVNPEMFTFDFFCVFQDTLEHDVSGLELLGRLVPRTMDLKIQRVFVERFVRGLEGI